jgi:hypothetical protein
MKNNNEDSRRDFLVNALGLGLITGINAIGLIQPVYALGGLPDRLPKGQSIYKLSGHVIVDGQVANIKTQIRPNSKIQTGKDSEIIFVVGTDAFILRSNSEIEFSATGLLIQGLRIVSGAILSVFGKRESSHKIVTTTATIGIRGTGIYVDAEPDRTYACTCYGHTQISANANPNVVQNIVTEHHEEPVYILPKASQQKLIVTAPVKDHADSELNLIEALVGRKTPFGSGGYNYKDRN